MRVDLFDFELPQDRIALRPVSPRDSAKLLLVDGDRPLEDRSVRDLPDLLRPGDCLVFNDTRVIPAQLTGRRGEARIGATLHKRLGLRQWQAFVRNAKRLRSGDVVDFGEDASAIVASKEPDGSVVFEFLGEEPVEALLERVGATPLPPYIASQRAIDERDKADYQTMFAQKDGAVAAPTASLHFTPDLIKQLDAAHIERATVTLHVGAGTFLPVKVEDTQHHVMHSEWGSIDAQAAATITRAKESGGRVMAVGTTSLRLLESAADASGRISEWAGDTDIFITPGYDFRIVDGLMTNFHLPKSTLMMLVSALMGRERIMDAYRHAIAHDYRFYSYGDSSLLIPERSA